MNKIRLNLAHPTVKLRPAIKIEEGFLSFTERPSDKYNTINEGVTSEPARKNAFELFSLFTADIIKEKVVFIR